MIIFIVLLLVGQEYISYLLCVFIFPRDVYIDLPDTENTNQHFMRQSTSSVRNKHAAFPQLLCPQHLGWDPTKQVQFGILIVTLPVSRFLLLLHGSSHSQDLGAPGVAILGLYPQFCLHLSIPFQGALPIPGLFFSLTFINNKEDKGRLTRVPIIYNNICDLSSLYHVPDILYIFSNSNKTTNHERGPRTQKESFLRSVMKDAGELGETRHGAGGPGGSSRWWEEHVKMCRNRVRH
ncbi:hypothetical protein HJG60_009356 [Phyllostomus discolor]|uniref:Uncharacterized protein n=1 Tax=Phyllostomus discolor TaxID=89673 RepID=A0A834DC02_9CHIR|nr:hypothetical protein HJG60_009356 [Phyllostomus discolor]